MKELKILLPRLKQKNTTQPSLLYPGRLAILEKNHIFIYSDWKKRPKDIVLKVWLKKKYTDIKKALKDVGIEFQEY